MDVPGHAMTGCTAHDETGALIAISLSCQCGQWDCEARMAKPGVVTALQALADEALEHLTNVVTAGRISRYVGLDAYDGEPG